MLSLSVKESAEPIGPPPSPTDAWPHPWPTDMREFELLVDQFTPALMRYACRRLRNVHDAEDVVQEVFVKASLLRRRRHVHQVAAYLYRMTANGCMDTLRKRLRRAQSAGRLEQEAPGGDRCAPTPRDLAAAADEAQQVDRLLRRLPRAQAEAIRLRVFGGLDLGEIAVIMGCSANTVSSRLRYGFQKLRRIVAKECTP